MKKQTLLIIASIFGISQVQAQQGKFLENASLEASYGYAMPLSPTKNIEASNYNSFLNFQGGLNYEFNNLLGARATYAYQTFEDKNNSNLGVSYHKFMLEATFNILAAINESSSYSKNNSFDVQAHAGVGATLATRKLDNATNKIANLQLGLKPTYAINNRFNVFLDATYVMNFNQAYEFSGYSIEGSTTGGYFTTNVGIQVKLGK